jgi:predicted metalloendopeptidase
MHRDHARGGIPGLHKMRGAARIAPLKVDPHSPGRFRANGDLRNQGHFEIAFAVTPCGARCTG